MSETMDEGGSDDHVPKVGQHVSVYWEGDKEYFNGNISKIQKGVFYLVHYDDQQTEWLPIGEHKYRLLPNNESSFLPEENMQASAEKNMQASPETIPDFMKVSPSPLVLHGPPLLRQQSLSGQSLSEPSKDNDSESEFELEELNTQKTTPTTSTAPAKEFSKDLRSDPSRFTESIKSCWCLMPAM